MKRDRTDSDQASRRSRHWDEAGSSDDCASKPDHNTGDGAERDGADPTLAGGGAAAISTHAAAASPLLCKAQEDAGSAEGVPSLPGQAYDRSNPGGASGSMKPSEGGWDSEAGTVAGEPPAGASAHEAVPQATRQAAGKLTQFDLRVYWFLTTLPKAHQRPVLDLLAAKERTSDSTWAEVEAVLGKAREHRKPRGLLVQQAQLWLPWPVSTCWCMAFPGHGGRWSECCFRPAVCAEAGGASSRVSPSTNTNDLLRSYTHVPRKPDITSRSTG